MGGNPFLLEKELALGSRFDRSSASMQKSNLSCCPTITCEEALKRELEYRKRLEKTHPHLLIGLSPTSMLSKEITTDQTPLELRIKSASESSLPSPQASVGQATAARQPVNWYPSKKKVKVQHPPAQILQSPRPNLVPSFWCKICKVDCVTEHNFDAHIGGKKHKAKRLEILGHRNTGRPGSHCVGNRNPGPSGNAVSGSRTNKPNAGYSNGAEPSSDMTSRSRTNGPNENGCSAPSMNGMQLAMQSENKKDGPHSFSSEMLSGICSSHITRETSASYGAGPSSDVGSGSKITSPNENVDNAPSANSTLFAQISDDKKDAPHFSSFSEMHSGMCSSQIPRET